MSVDPAMTPDRNMGNPQRWNRYTYAVNNAITRFDPNGQQDQIYIINTLGSGAFGQRALNNLNGSVKGTRFEGHVQVIGPMASRGQVQAWTGHADSKDMVAIVIHSGSTKDWKPSLGGIDDDPIPVW